MLYHRFNAAKYASIFYNKVCSDGVVATNAGYPKFPAGTPLKETFNKPNYVGHEDDCTHFISCCIGRTAGKINLSWIDFAYKGGGLHVPSPFKGAGVYGHTHVSHIYYFVQGCGAKIIGDEFRNRADPATAADIAANLTFGDLLVYSSQQHIRHHEH